MARIEALFRYPIKGFTPEPRESLVVQADGRIQGDRVLAFRFADAAEPEIREGLDTWPKLKGLALMSIPSLAPLRVTFDDHTRRVSIRHEGRLLVDAALDDDGRTELVEAVTAFVLAGPDARQIDGGGRLPLRLVGDGVTSRFQDRARGYVSVHSQASTAALTEAMQHDADDRRFRSNIVISGVDAWEELSWSGRVRVGDVTFIAAGPIVRCAATHANPDTGARDAPVLRTLTRTLGQSEPTMGRLLLLEGVSGAVGDTAGRGGVIRVGDPVTVD